MQVEGIGPVVATAPVAAVGNAREFTNGRHLAAWLGLVPRQFSTGGKERLLGISKRGDRYLRTLLIHGARYQVMVAANGAEALRHLYETPVQVALVDLRLGDEDGIAVMALLHQGQPDLPVIIMTAYATTESALAAGKQGAFDYLPKPFAAAELLRVVARAREESHARSLPQ